MRTPLAILLAAGSALCQSNAVPGLDVTTYDLTNVTVYGREGAPFPNGTAGMNLGHSMCNSGSVIIPWDDGVFGGVMLPTYPKIASMAVMESNGRMVQISMTSRAKHSGTAFNFASGPCAPCQSGPSNTWRIGCSDTYSSGFSNASNLGPTSEIDPWLGTWDPVGSYFDQGDPAVVGAQATDGIRSPISGGGIKNRMLVREQDLVTPGTFYGQVHTVVIGEPGANRANNQCSRQLTFSWNGSSWSSSVTGAAVIAPVLTRWSGASTAVGSNGPDDGRFMVGWKVTGPVGGLWHYEYAVQNLDNNSGAAAFRLPICPTARVLNVGFHDIDDDPLNDWQLVRNGGEIAFQAGANNSLPWNTLFNFWFDSDAAPGGADVLLDRALPGPGALSVTVAAEAPTVLGHEYLGAGCGAPAPQLFANGLASVPNAGYALQLQGTPLAASILVFSLATDNAPLGNGCVRWIDDTLITASDIAVAGPSGIATWNLPIPPGYPTIDGFCQAAELLPGGPWLGSFALANGLRLRVGGTGCP